MSHVSNKAAALLVACATFASAQVTATVGPPTAPVGCPIWISVSNDTPSGIFLSSPCPYVVKDAFGVAIYTPFCIAIIQPIAAGGTFTTTWPQINDFGIPVGAGNYVVQVNHPGGPTNVPITISTAATGGVAQLGTAKIGVTRNLGLCSPGDGGFTYVAAAAFTTTPGIVTCAGTIPLAADALLTLSLTPGNGVFNNFLGTLDATGRSTAPSITVPNLPALVGLSFWTAFVVYDPNAPCQIRSISEATEVFIF
ncbi:MAG TPA: hypothetical protein VEI02_03030 [Planctomycetota bacterium]|nr:hypothetical protein [Planctomycetota bacterium]